VARIALATCAALPHLDPDDLPLVPTLAALGIEAEPAVWDDPSVDWSEFDLVLLRSTWDYAERLEDFLAWARSLERVLNPVSVLEWNTDKARYLADLAAAGVTTVPTTIIRPGDPFATPEGEYVVKPAVSAGGRSSGRFTGDAGRELVERINSEGRAALVQPYLVDAEAAGEIGLVFVDGQFTHAVQRVVLLPTAPTSLLYLDERVGPASATPEQLEVARAALAAAPEGDLLYARVDLLGGAVNELELAEPSLYLTYGPEAAARLAEAVAARLP
jgi:glutathione synthase/RimK-type ligase-like ATP-grasp enzyme